MKTHRVGDPGSQIRSLLAIGPASSWTDGQLLDRFVEGDRSASGPAFEALVERHGPMVLRVCRSVLRDPHDAQDAFQATFLVLVRKAGSIRDRDSLASWLHGVALRVAGHARADLARRRRLERSAADRAGPTGESEPVADLDLGPRLHQEVGRLPERYRAAVVLCYLEGHTCEDAARVLGWPVGTVKSRLSRARDRLRARLGRLDLSSPFPPLPPDLARSTAGLASRHAAGATPPGLAAASLAEGVSKLMNLAKWRSVGFALLAAASGLGVASTLAPGQDPPKAEAPKKPDRDRRKVEAPKQAETTPRAAEAEPIPDPIARTIPRLVEAHAGAGTIRMIALDAKGERIVERGGPNSWKEVDVDKRWAVVTAVVDNQGVREALTLARKVDLADSFADYKRVDVQRQVRWPEGDWSGWQGVDAEKNYEVLDNSPSLPLLERTPEPVRPPALVDPLLMLTKGAWEGVDPEAILRLPKPAPDQVGDDGRPRLRSPLLAVRSFDFTVEPRTTYRYRVRVVLFNPDKEKGGKLEVFGPWSGPSKEVAVR